MESQTLNNAAANAHGAVNKAAAAAKDTVMQAKPVIERAAGAAHKAVDKGADIAAPAAEWLGAQADALLSMPKKIADGGAQTVKAHPWKAVGTALVLGLLLSRIL